MHIEEIVLNFLSVTELVIAKRLLEVILSNSSYSDDKTDIQRDE